MKIAKFLLATLLTLASALSAEEASSKFAQVAAIPLQDLQSHEWPDRQFLQSDKEGRVFLLREETLDLYQLSPDGALKPKGRLIEGQDSEKQPVAGAAMSFGGDVWVLFSFPNHLEVFQGGKRTEQLEAPWMLSAVTAGSGEPQVAVMPAEMASATPATLRLNAPPLLQSWDGKNWNTLVEGQFPGERPDGVSRPEQLRGEFGAFLIPTQERHLWMADEHTYRLRHFSPAGALKDELVVGARQVQWKERTSEQWAKAEATAQRTGIPFSHRSLSAVRAEEVVRGVALGRDETVYLLVRTDKGLALDRFSPAFLTLDRVILSGVQDSSGRFTMASGRQDLYLAASAGRDGLWHIESETLDKAAWQPVSDVLWNGQPLVPVKEKDKEKNGVRAIKTTRP